MTTSYHRFRPLKYVVSELKNSYLYFSTIDKLNDPMECFYRLFFNENGELYKNLFKHFIKNIHSDNKCGNFNNLDSWIDENLREIVESLANKGLWAEDLKPTLINVYIRYYGKQNKIKRKVNTYIKELKELVINEKLVCSFSKLDNNINLSNNEILMWAHYASGHSGICLEFSDIVAQDENLQDKLKKSPIIYSNNDIKNLQFSVGLAASNNENKLEFLGNRIQLGELQLIYNGKYETIYHTKLKAWEYESEYRYSIRKSDLIDSKSLLTQKLKYDFSCLKSITFGERTPQNKRDEITKIIDKKCREYHHKVAFYEVYIDDSFGKFKRKLYKDLY